MRSPDRDDVAGEWFGHHALWACLSSQQGTPCSLWMELDGVSGLQADCRLSNPLAFIGHDFELVLGAHGHPVAHDNSTLNRI